MLLDNLAIPKDAPHVEEAYAFIDFLLRPAIAARNTNFTHLANGVLASKSSIDKDISGTSRFTQTPRCCNGSLRSANHDPAARKDNCPRMGADKNRQIDAMGVTPCPKRGDHSKLRVGRFDRTIK